MEQQAGHCSAQHDGGSAGGFRGAAGLYEGQGNSACESASVEDFSFQCPRQLFHVGSTLCVYLLRESPRVWSYERHIDII